MDYNKHVTKNFDGWANFFNEESSVLSILKPVGFAKNSKLDQAPSCSLEHMLWTVPTIDRYFCACCVVLWWMLIFNNWLITHSCIFTKMNYARWVSRGEFIQIIVILLPYQLWTIEIWRTSRDRSTPPYLLTPLKYPPKHISTISFISKI